MSGRVHPQMDRDPHTGQALVGPAPDKLKPRILPGRMSAASRILHASVMLKQMYPCIACQCWDEAEYCQPHKSRFAGKR